MPSKITWTNACENVFQVLKDRLTSGTMIQSTSKIFVLRIDARKLGFCTAAIAYRSYKLVKPRVKENSLAIVSVVYEACCSGTKLHHT